MPSLPRGSGPASDVSRLTQLELIDFGATREYSERFMSLYEQLLRAAISENRPDALRFSRELGYLTGEESEVRSTSCPRNWFWH